jgi:hypothetical protein
LIQITEYYLGSEIQKVAVAWAYILVEKPVGKLPLGILNRYVRMDSWEVP